MEGSCCGQMNGANCKTWYVEFCDLFGTLYAPVSKIVSFKLEVFLVQGISSQSEKVIWLCWECRFLFLFLLIFLILHVHEIETFMLNSSVFIFLTMRFLYRTISKNAKSFFSENILNVPNINWFKKNQCFWWVFVFYL